MNHKVLSFFVIGLLIITSLLYYLYSSGYFYIVKIEGENIIIKSDNLELSKNINISLSNSTIITHGGQLIDFNLTILNNNEALCINITRITVSSPFILISAPHLPITVFPNSTSSAIISIKTPMAEYSSPIIISLYVVSSKA
ncbi:hypothetical protein [Acidianus manzaensis]|uniref:Uncharacterized protein n=1 Tax=Acidianus manzaensis TaxID=282676 RepID=A0A1W6K103_9CREN|nr:hypothetical protein [Acidianus manzaensis]ARM76175.1 hypothetical protein B6F84_09175 [Acidianus manzaensis]